MGKAIRNYATGKAGEPVNQRVQETLISHGAPGVPYEYEQGTGRIAELKFAKAKKVRLALPSVEEFSACVEPPSVRRRDDEDFGYRVVWRNIRHMALAPMRSLELPQNSRPSL
jgi:hypothetical protein